MKEASRRKMEEVKKATKTETTIWKEGSKNVKEMKETRRRKIGSCKKATATTIWKERSEKNNAMQWQVDHLTEKNGFNLTK